MMLRSLPLAFAVSLLACSSGDFSVSNNPSGDDGGTDSQASDSGSPGGDTATDTFVDPCAPDPTAAKFCVDVKLEKLEHPGYDAGSGAATLGIDGKGIVYVALFDTDPAASLGGGPSPTPKAVLQYPPADHVGEEASIDKDLPVTLSGRAAPGTYWVITQFSDNTKATRGTGENGVLPGDFVIVPNIDATTRTAQYPKVTLTMGTTGRVEQKLRPYRRVDVDMGASADLASKAATNPTIHGDGPVLFAIYDGDFNSKTPTVLSVASSPCVSIHPAMTPPVRTNVSFGTTVDGEHRLFALLFDYTVDTKSSTLGNIYVQTKLDDPVYPAPKVNISSTSWVSSAHADFHSVYFPYDVTSTVVDKLTCK